MSSFVDGEELDVSVFHEPDKPYHLQASSGNRSDKRSRSTNYSDLRSARRSSRSRSPSPSRRYQSNRAGSSSSRGDYNSSRSGHESRYSRYSRSRSRSRSPKSHRDVSRLRDEAFRRIDRTDSRDRNSSRSPPAHQRNRDNDRRSPSPANPSLRITVDNNMYGTGGQPSVRPNYVPAGSESSYIVQPIKTSKKKKRPPPKTMMEREQATRGRGGGYGGGRGRESSRHASPPPTGGGYGGGRGRESSRHSSPPLTGGRELEKVWKIPKVLSARDMDCYDDDVNSSRLARPARPPSPPDIKGIGEMHHQKFEHKQDVGASYFSSVNAMADRWGTSNMDVKKEAPMLGHSSFEGTKASVGWSTPYRSGPPNQVASPSATTEEGDESPKPNFIIPGLGDMDPEDEDKFLYGDDDDEGGVAPATPTTPSKDSQVPGLHSDAPRMDALAHKPGWPRGKGSAQYLKPEEAAGAKMESFLREIGINVNPSRPEQDVPAETLQRVAEISNKMKNMANKPASRGSSSTATASIGSQPTERYNNPISRSPAVSAVVQEPPITACDQFPAPPHMQLHAVPYQPYPMPPPALMTQIPFHQGFSPYYDPNFVHLQAQQQHAISQQPNMFSNFNQASMHQQITATPMSTVQPRPPDTFPITVSSRPPKSLNVYRNSNLNSNLKVIECVTGTGMANKPAAVISASHLPSSPITPPSKTNPPGVGPPPRLPMTSASQSKTDPPKPNLPSQEQMVTVPKSLEERQTLSEQYGICKSKLAILEDELQRLNKKQGELMRKKQRQKDGHKDPQLVGNGKVQEDISRQVATVKRQMLAMERALKVADSKEALNRRAASDALKTLSKSPPATHSSSSFTKKSTAVTPSVAASTPVVPAVSPSPVSVVGASSKPSGTSTAPSKNYRFIDHGDHWCKHCNGIFSRAPDLLLHLHTKHRDVMEKVVPADRPWAVKPVDPKPSKAGEMTLLPFRGIEFVLPCQAFFCTLCKEFSGDVIAQRNHLESDKHNFNYSKFCKANPTYAKRTMRCRSASVARHNESSGKRKTFDNGGRNNSDSEDSHSKRLRSESNARARDRSSEKDQEPKKKSLDEEGSKSENKEDKSSANTKVGIKLNLLKKDTNHPQNTEAKKKAFRDSDMESSGDDDTVTISKPGAKIPMKIKSKSVTKAVTAITTTANAEATKTVQLTEEQLRSQRILSNRLKKKKQERAAERELESQAAAAARATPLPLDDFVCIATNQGPVYGMIGGAGSTTEVPVLKDLPLLTANISATAQHTLVVPCAPMDISDVHSEMAKAGDEDDDVMLLEINPTPPLPIVILDHPEPLTVLNISLPPTEEPSTISLPPTEEPSAISLTPTEEPSAISLPPTEEPSAISLPPTEESEPPPPGEESLVLPSSNSALLLPIGMVPVPLATEDSEPPPPGTESEIILPLAKLIPPKTAVQTAPVLFSPNSECPVFGNVNEVLSSIPFPTELENFLDAEIDQLDLAEISAAEDPASEARADNVPQKPSMLKAASSMKEGEATEAGTSVSKDKESASSTGISLETENDAASVLDSNSFPKNIDVAGNGKIDSDNMSTVQGLAESHVENEVSSTVGDEDKDMGKSTTEESVKIPGNINNGCSIIEINHLSGNKDSSLRASPVGVGGASRNAEESSNSECILKGDENCSQNIPIEGDKCNEGVNADATLESISDTGSCYGDAVEDSGLECISDTENLLEDYQQGDNAEQKSISEVLESVSDEESVEALEADGSKSKDERDGRTSAASSMFDVKDHEDMVVLDSADISDTSEPSTPKRHASNEEDDNCAGIPPMEVTGSIDSPKKFEPMKEVESEVESTMGAANEITSTNKITSLVEPMKEGGSEVDVTKGTASLSERKKEVLASEKAQSPSSNVVFAHDGVEPNIELSSETIALLSVQVPEKCDVAASPKRADGISSSEDEEPLCGLKVTTPPPMPAMVRRQMARCSRGSRRGGRGSSAVPSTSRQVSDLIPCAVVVVKQDAVDAIASQAIPISTEEKERLVAIKTAAEQKAKCHEQSETEAVSSAPKRARILAEELVSAVDMKSDESQIDDTFLDNGMEAVDAGDSDLSDSLLDILKTEITEGKITSLLDEIYLGPDVRS